MTVRCLRICLQVYKVTNRYVFAKSFSRAMFASKKASRKTLWQSHLAFIEAVNANSFFDKNILGH